MVAKRAFIFLILVAVAQVVIYYPQLPEPTASHFDGSGRPNGWMSRNVFFAVHLGVIALMAFSFVYFPAQMGRISLNVWSIPNREYWLADERRDETLRFIREQMLWCGVVSIAFILVVIQMAIEANLNPPVMLSSNIRWLLIFFFAYMFAWVARIIRRFWRVPA